MPVTPFLVNESARRLVCTHQGSLSIHGTEATCGPGEAKSLGELNKASVLHIFGACLTVAFSLQHPVASALLTTQDEARPTEKTTSAAIPGLAVGLASAIRGTPAVISDSEIYSVRARTAASTAA